MAKEKVTQVVKSVGKEIDKHGPEIAISIGVVGLVVAGVEAVRATPKALRLIEQKKESVEPEELSFKDIVETSWKFYVIPVVVGAASVFCIVSASKENWKRKAALTTAYTITEAKFSDYQSKVIDILGHEKDEEIKSAIAKDKIQNNPVQNVILVDGTGDTICYDVLSGRYFKSNKENIRQAVNYLNTIMLDGSSVSLNDFYDEIGLESIKLGEMLGWNIGKGMIDVDFSSQLDAAGNPCLVIDYQLAPAYDYIY